MDFNRASINIENIVKIFEERKKCHGPHYENTITAAKCLTFKGMALQRKSDPPACPNDNKENLKISTRKRLLDGEEVDLPKWDRILDPTHLPEDVDSHLTFCDKEIRNLSKRLGTE
jgi:hypothetical protein